MESKIESSINKYQKYVVYSYGCKLVYIDDKFTKILKHT